MEPIFIKETEMRNTNALGIIELTADEQLAKAIYQATGDFVFKGFLPLTWKTALIVKMRNALDKLKEQKKPISVFNMQMMVPEVSAAAHDYFIRNVDKVKGVLPTPQQAFSVVKPVLWIAGLAAAAYLLSQVKVFFPKGKEKTA